MNLEIQISFENNENLELFLLDQYLTANLKGKKLGSMLFFSKIVSIDPKENHGDFYFEFVKSNLKFIKSIRIHRCRSII